MTFADATPKLLQKVAEESAGIKLTVKAEDIKALADPLKLVEACNVKGGPAPAKLKERCASVKNRCFCTKSNISKMDKELEEAENKLESIVQSYLTAKKRENTRFKNST